VLLGEELGAEGAVFSDEPHPAGAPLSDQEITEVVRWIELGATFVGTMERE